jgi:uroporphyrin-III C-methyltransferase / precorrin-2 dehydrogenase / sirohydrochlorin ferrochelatase
MSSSPTHARTSARRTSHVCTSHLARRTSHVIGFVSLVGAGPGDPDLLTRKAVRCLERADVVLYDALVDVAALELAPSAKRVFVGKRAGRPAVRQEFIERLMIRLARQGRRVVRLKGGDPFVFGRGGEEAIALGRAGVEFEVVPGVSSAIAAPLLAGIPVTHRGVSAAFVVVSGHAEAAYGPVIDSLAPHAATLVVMMGIGRLEALSVRLVSRGWRRTTLVAVVLGAATPDVRTLMFTLGRLAAGVEYVTSDRPGTIVVGDVVGVRAAICRQADGEAGAGRAEAGLCIA